MTNGRTLIIGGVVAVAIVAALFVTADRWAPADAGLLLVVLFPAALIVAALPILLGVLLQFRRGLGTADRLVVAAGIAALALLGWYVRGYLA